MTGTDEEDITIIEGHDAVGVYYIAHYSFTEISRDTVGIGDSRGEAVAHLQKKLGDCQGGEHEKMSFAAADWRAT